MSESSRAVALGDILTPVKAPASIEDSQLYEQVTVRIKGKGLVRRCVLTGAEIATKRQFLVRAGQLLVSKIDARNGGMGIVPPELDGAIVSGDFPAFEIDESVCLPAYLDLYTRRQPFWDECWLVSEGSTHRVRLSPEQFLELQIELPSFQEQERIVEKERRVAQALQTTQAAAERLDALFRVAATEIFEAIDADERSIGELTRLSSGGTPPRDDPANYGGGILWAKTGEVRFNRLSDTEERITEAGLANSSAKLLPAGTVLLAMYGQGATRGRCALLMRPMATNQASAAILPSDAFDSEFLFYFLWSRYEAIRRESEGRAQDNPNQGIVADIELPLPSLAQQQNAVRRLNVIRRAVDTHFAEADGLRTFRARLVEELLPGGRRANEFATA